MKKELKRIKRLEDELALLKADLSKKKEPIMVSFKFKFEVYPKDLPGIHSHVGAKLAIKEELGNDWRLPTREELLLMYETRDLIGGFAGTSYWSSTEFVFPNAWVQGFGNGFQFSNDKSFTYYVRAVRDIKE